MQSDFIYKITLNLKSLISQNLKKNRYTITTKFQFERSVANKETGCESKRNYLKGKLIDGIS